MNASHVLFAQDEKATSNTALWKLLQPDGHVYESMQWEPPAPVPPSTELTEDNFDVKVIEDSKMWMVEFYAPWCSVCQSFEKEWTIAAANLKGWAKFGHVDATVHTGLAQRFNVTHFPAILHWANGGKGELGETGGPIQYGQGLTNKDVYRYVMEAYSHPQRSTSRLPPSMRKDRVKRTKIQASDKSAEQYHFVSDKPETKNYEDL